jgi:glutamate/tyrosine decarboxylase-like PLP-dependent enzyme
VQAEEGGPRETLDYNPEFSRRARGFAVYAALRALGRSGVAELVEQRCALAARFASLLAPVEGVEVIQPVTLNQVMVRFHSPDGDHDAHTRRVIQAIQDDGTCWMSGTVWQDRAAMRISVANWSTDESDVDRSVEAIIRCHSAATAPA